MMLRWFVFFEPCALLARLRVDSSAIVTRPVVSGDTLYVQTASGTIAAYRDADAEAAAEDSESFDSQLDDGFGSGPKSGDGGFGSGFELN